MLRPAAALALALVAGVATADTAPAPLWITRQEAQPWRAAIALAADRSGLAPALIAELVGIESGFRTVHNPRSSAYGCGQQLDANPWMIRNRLNRGDCAQSIMGAALQFRDGLAHTGSLAGAAARYGTTAHLTSARRKAILARLDRAAARMVAQQVAPIVGELRIP